MQSTLSEQTHPGMLPQSQALKVPFDAPAKAKAGTSETESGERRPKASLGMDQADFQHGRGERPAPGEAGPSPSLHLREENRGVTRAFVIAKNGAFPVKARQLLRSGRACIHRLYPYTIRLVDRKEGAKQPVVLKIDPGATTTGIALNRQELEQPTNQSVLHLAEITFIAEHKSVLHQSSDQPSVDGGAALTCLIGRHASTIEPNPKGGCRPARSHA